MTSPSTTFKCTTLCVSHTWKRVVGALATIHYKCWTWLGQRVFGEIRRRKGGASVEINKSETPFIMYVCMYVCISMYVQYISICPEAIILYVCMYILHMYGHGRGIWGGGAYCSRGRPYSAPHRCVCNSILPPPLLPISSFTLEDVVSTTGFLCPRWSWSWQGVLLGQGPFWAIGERDRGSDAPNTTTHHPNGRAWCHFHYLYCCHHRHCSRFLS